MPRPAAFSPDQIRTTVLAMLAEADPDPAHAPPTSDHFRRVVSVRKLRARLGAGDPAMLSRALNTIEAEVVRAGLALVAIPGLPEPVAEQMRALWQAAVSVQLDEVIQMKAAATQATEAAQGARRDADLRIEMIQVELSELRTQLNARDSELANLRADCRSLTERADMLKASAVSLQAELVTTRSTLAETRQTHAEAFAAVHARYEGLSRQLLQETEHQRHALQGERERLAGQITQTLERTAALEGLRDRLLAELATERECHQRAAAEAAALTVLVDKQRALLQAVKAERTSRTMHATLARSRPASSPGRRRRTLASSPVVTTSPALPRPAARKKAR